MTYKFTDSTNTVVADGNGWSGLVTASEVQEWIAAGNTPEPADVSPPPTPAQQLAQLDAENALTQRNLRDFILLTAAAMKTITNGVFDIETIPGVKNVAEVEAKAAELRAQL